MSARSPATVPGAWNAEPAAPSTLLARDVRAVAVDVAAVVRPDGVSRGAVCARVGRLIRRAEPGSAGPLLFEACRVDGGTAVEVWGPRATAADEAERALAAATAWAGLDDDPEALGDVVAGDSVLRGLLRQVGAVRLSRTPRVGEALGRAVVEQLVQSGEARRSIADVAAATGTPASTGLWCWPTAAQIGATPAWTLRRCGVSLRAAGALHAGAVDDSRLTAAAAAAAAGGEAWDVLDRRLRALPGVGAWTSAEVRLRLGDPDAVSVGDYHLPTTVGVALAGPDGDGPGGGWTDAGMLALLAPFAGQRGRVIRLIEMAVRRGLAPREARRAPRAAVSAHRRW